MAVEVHRLGTLLKSQDDIDVAGRRPRRDGFLDMVADCGRRLHPPEYRYGPGRAACRGSPDRIRLSRQNTQIEAADDARRRAAFAEEHNIKRGAHRVAGPVAFRLDGVQQAVKRDPRRLRAAGRARNSAVWDSGRRTAAVGHGGRGLRDRRQSGTSEETLPQPATAATATIAAASRAQALRDGRCEPLGPELKAAMPRPDQSVLCVPSQNGWPPVALQPQNHSSSVFSAVNGSA